jgi:predicted NBD/HSP70 family sugar kinase/DNA-binding HxlR family transcriptional regulator
MTATFILVNLTYEMADLRDGEPRAVPALLRTLNERTVLDAIRAAAPVSRAELARRTGISKPTVSLALRALLEDGLVRETSLEPDRPHFGAVYYEAEPDAAFVLGVDLGANALRAAICDLGGETRASAEVASRASSVAKRLDRLAGLVESLLAEADVPSGRLDRAVVGIPAVVSAEGRVSDSDIPGLERGDLPVLLEERLGVPVTLENDVNLAALGAARSGAARGEGDFAFVLVGEGLGAAVVLGGELHRGANGAAGELDAIRSGHAEDFDPSAGAIATWAAGRTADAVLEETARRIALHVVPLAATLDLPLVVVGGSVGGREELLEPIRRRLGEWLAFPPRVAVSTLGDAAVLTGALAAGVDATLEHVFERRVRA